MILVIETATTACSVALIDGDRVIARHHAEGARGHAERLIPMIADLPAGGRAEAILVNCGPGSFTGVRVGIAAARALGLGWGVPVTGYTTHALLAARLFHDHPDLDDALIAIEGGHGEIFIQPFARAPLAPLAPLASVRPESAPIWRCAAGSAAPQIAGAAAYDVAPDAADARHLPAVLRSAPPDPVYGRAPDAKPNP
ncbi:MAG: tRNA (adenosine(37)-N6)-threonylcarbamoyltransferase complex dimerization subunit type 1 TsaB [Chakrabartia sp.]